MLTPQELEDQLYIKRCDIQNTQFELDQTDWYACRLAEKGIPIPQDILEKRDEWRREIDRLRSECDQLIAENTPAEE